MIKNVIDIILNLDIYLNEIIAYYGIWSYLILFLVIFCETGLVITPFLPGDSLIFVIGALSAGGEINITIITLILIAAAILGDTVNFHIGKFLGPKVFNKPKIPFLKKEYLIKTHEFYERHGGKTIILARFIPIIRTFAPFVAGMGEMNYIKFISYNIIGGIVWVLTFVLGGYFFGNIQYVKDNFTMVIFAIIFISILPAIITYLKEKYWGQFSKK